MRPTRRDLLKGAAVTAAASATGVSLASLVEPTAPAPDGAPVNVTRLPDLVRVWGADGEIPLQRRGDSWEGGGVEVGIKNGQVSLRASVGVTLLGLRWRGDLTRVERILSDDWERSYADLAWRGREAARTLPWCFLATEGGKTHGYGVQTAPGAMCFWTADNEGASLWADLHSGGSPVRLGDRTLAVCTIVQHTGRKGESAFAAQRALYRAMCPNPRLAGHPVYGTNDWNYAYGNNSADLVANMSGIVSDLSPDTENRPYSVIDDGWSQGGLGHGPWFGNDKFGDMGAFATRLKGLGVRPGLWFRALTALPDSPKAWRSPRDAEMLDPTIPEVQEHVRSHFRRFVGWGYEMVKHDFSGIDLFGRWGSGMRPGTTRDGWRFADDTRTNAEVVLDLYRTIRESAGSMRLIGCNTFTHLAAGLHEVQRTGDDTSGRSWHRTRRMGVNTLAFRAAQQGTFYTVDPDIVAVTAAIPWELNEQWLRLVTGSGTALFVSVEPDFINDTHRAALRKSLAQAAKPQPVGEPLDWTLTDCPRLWRLNGKREEFHWMGESGAWPYGD